MLVSHIDRLCATTHAIRVAAEQAPPPRPFTKAVLETPLGDLIRDIDPAELGLFTPELARVQFHGPAPSRKQDPEVYAQAAFTYIDRYNAIRPMPRAYAQVVAILDQLEATRKSIHNLSATLDQIQPSEIKPLADQEELRVQEYQAKLADLRKRREAAVQPKPHKRPKPAPAPEPPSTPDSKLDETFHTPAAAGRALRFTDNMLMDEHVDLADISVTSPIAPFRIQEHESVAEEEEEEEQQPESFVDDDNTIVLPKPSEPAPPAAETPKQGKLRVNTEVERIVAKIWSTVGNLIMPGHPYDTSGAGAGPKPPRAKETMQAAHLQTVAALTPTPASPSTTASSTASASTPPTAQQILTAHMLLTLLAAAPQPMPLNKVKETLATKASVNGASGIIVLGGQSTTQVLYGCVAKRLLVIDRGGGEQVVRYNV